MIDDAFGHWMAGFIDGEGSFTIHQRARADGGRLGGQFSCRMTIGLRSDDLPILREMQSTLGIGFVSEYIPRAPVGEAKPQSTWIVSSKADCVELVRFLDRFPLRAKKARDYAVWREAVAEWGSVRNGGSGPRHDWTRMAELKCALEEGRRFVESTNVPVVLPKVEDLQLPLGFAS